METKIEKLRRWLCLHLCPQPKVVPLVIKTRVVDDHTLETFQYEGYDIEAAIYADHVRICAFLKGDRCLDGWLYDANTWAWSYITETDHVPSHGVRAYLKHYAQSRFKE